MNQVVKQKDSVINKIVESRRETIQGLEAMKLSIDSKESQLDEGKEKYTQINNELIILQKKYSEMFEINTHFNKRIYELERQKKDLLDLLKENNIHPDPTKLSQQD